MGDGAAACRLPSEKLLAGLQRLLQQPADPLQQRAPTADQEAEATRLLRQTRAVAPPRLAPFCEQFCRKTHHLECPGGFEAQLAAAIERHAGAARARVTVRVRVRERGKPPTHIPTYSLTHSRTHALTH